MSRELLIVSWFVGSFDTLAVVESRADQGDQLGCVDGAPAGPGGLEQLAAIARPAAREPGPLMTPLPQPAGGEGRLDRGS